MSEQGLFVLMGTRYPTWEVFQASYRSENIAITFAFSSIVLPLS
ncbi:MAG: hypothetical protein AAF632_20035 [Bacteroidota bacterium]